VNFVTVHDGFTLYDLLSYEKKQNACGPLNPRCCADPLTPFCDRDSGENHNRSRNWGDEPTKRQMFRNLLVGLFISHGTPMLFGGDEWMRTQLGNNNAYSSGADSAFNWFDWGAWAPSFPRQRMHDFVRSLIAFRKANQHAFAPPAYGEGAPFAWKSAGNTDQVDWNSRHLMQHYFDREQGSEVLILINMESSGIDFTLPGGTAWRRVIDTQSFFDSDAHFSTVGQDPRTSANFDSAGVPAAGSFHAVARSIVVLVGE